MENREVINDVLVHLFNEIMELEEQAIITEEYKDITNNDMHIIEAVGLGGNKMSDIAAKLNITVGSLTTSMNSLVKKGYATRERSEQDRRVVFIHLTLKGRKAYHHHAEFHRKMTDAVLDVLDEKYVTTAYAKGLKNKVVLVKHVLRNAMIPVTVMFFLSLPWLIGGAVVVENVFAWPGMGQLIWKAISKQDFVIVQGVVLVITILTVICNLIGDILAGILDPRIRLE